MLSITLFFTCLSLAVGNPIYAGDRCAVSTVANVGDLKTPQPLILARTKKDTKILYPDKNGILSVPRGRSIHLACPGKGNHLNNTGTSMAEAVCVRDKIFSVNDLPRNFSSLVCKSAPWHQTIVRRSSSCLGKYSVVQIGFNVVGVFVPTIEVCRNNKTYVTYYTKFKMTKNISAVQRGFRRPRWLVGQHYPNLDVDNAYKFDTQFETVARLLGSRELADKYFKRSVQFLSRGHMAARSDFLYATEQYATFYYLNAAPQWQSFNGGNWNKLEMSVRSFASRRELDLDVYTGVHGQMTMTDVNGNRRPIELSANGTGTPLPVPRYYWKIIHDPASRAGIAFVGLNDPFVKRITRSVYLCPDISSRVNWLQWDAGNATAGLSYACTVGELRKAVPTVPKLDVVNVLM